MFGVCTNLVTIQDIKIHVASFQKYINFKILLMELIESIKEMNIILMILKILYIEHVLERLAND